MTRSALIPIWIKNQILGKTVRYYKSGPTDFTLVNETDMKKWIKSASHGIVLENIIFNIYYVHYCSIILDTTISMHDSYFQITSHALITADESEIIFVQTRFRLHFKTSDDSSNSIKRYTCQPIELKFSIAKMQYISKKNGICSIIKCNFQQNNATSCSYDAKKSIYLKDYYLYVYDNSMLQCVITPI